jgi:hypothetical protein
MSFWWVDPVYGSNSYNGLAPYYNGDTGDGPLQDVAVAEGLAAVGDSITVVYVDNSAGPYSLAVPHVCTLRLWGAGDAISGADNSGGAGGNYARKNGVSAQTLVIKVGDLTDPDGPLTPTETVVRDVGLITLCKAMANGRGTPLGDVVYYGGLGSGANLGNLGFSAGGGGAGSGGDGSDAYLDNDSHGWAGLGGVDDGELGGYGQGGDGQDNVNVGKAPSPGGGSGGDGTQVGYGQVFVTWVIPVPVPPPAAGSTGLMLSLLLNKG